MKMNLPKINLTGAGAFVAAYWREVALIILVVGAGWLYNETSRAREQVTTLRAELRLEGDVEAKKAELKAADDKLKAKLEELKASETQITTLRSRYIKMFKDLEWARKQLETINLGTIEAGLKDKDADKLVEEFQRMGINAEKVQVPK